MTRRALLAKDGIKRRKTGSALPTNCQRKDGLTLVAHHHVHHAVPRISFTMALRRMTTAPSASASLFLSS